MIGKSQNDCRNAKLIQLSDSLYLFPSSDSVIWCKYFAETSNFGLQFDFGINSQMDTLTGLYLFSGTCDNLTEISTVKNPDNLIITAENLPTKQYYYIKITKSTNSANLFFHFNTDPIINCNSFNCSDNTSLSCDLICNGNFESYYPNPPSNISQVGLACPWGSVNGANPDYFNSDATAWSVTLSNQVQVPLNAFGSQLSYNSALGNKGYAGFGINDSPNYQEYIYQKFKAPLIQGVTYNVQMRVSRADRYKYAANNIGIYLSANNPYVAGPPGFYTSAIPYNPSQTLIYNNYVTDATNWTLISFNFTPQTSGIQYITIGGFGNTTLIVADNSAYVQGCYYYVDEVHITAQVPNYNIVATPNPVCSGNTTSLTNNLNIPLNWSANPTTTFSCPTNCASTTATINEQTTITGTLNIAPGCTSTSTIVVNKPTIVKPTLSGSLNTCDLTTLYTITNPQVGTTYTWSATYSSNITGSNTQKSITWNNSTFPAPPSFGNIRIIANNGCLDTTDFKVWKCCTNGTSPNYSNTTVTSSFPAGIVYINGNVTVSSTSPINQTQTYFYMGPEAKITVNTPNFILENKTIAQAGCNYMWDGIYVNGTNNKVTLNGVPIIKEAYNAINSTNGGNFEVINTNFYSNYIGIKVTDYRPANLNNHPGIVNGSTFDGTTNMISPYLGQKTYTGIYTDNVYNFTIGNTTTINTFSNLFCGIQSFNTYLTVIHNKFQYIHRTPVCSAGEITDYSQLYCETAIHVAKKTSSLLDPLNPIVTIGGDNSSYGNTFTSCDLAYNSYLAKQTIKNNTVNSCQTGYFIRDLIYPSLINNNTFNSSLSCMFITSTTPSARGITIENNTLNSVGTNGIRVFNCKSIGVVKTNILTNSVNYNTAVANGKGIYAANCDAITIKGNTISSAAVSSSGLRKVMRGVNIENCPNAVIKSNILNNLGTGIYAEGMIVGTQFQCNTLFQNYYGFYMPGLSVATVYSDQGTSAMPNDNQWTADHPSPASGIPTYRITGDANSTIVPQYWYYRAGVNSYYPNVVSPNPATSFALMTQLTSNYPSPCSSKGGDDNERAEDIATTMDTIIPANSNLAIQMRYLYMSMLYNSNAEQFASEIGQDEQGLYLNIPLIAKINNLAQNDSTIENAIALNNILEPINAMETYRKFVNDIYLNYVAKEVQPSANVISELYTIADMAPNIGGEAVYIARAILNYNPESLHRDNIVVPINITANNNYQYYPNPATDVLNISSVNLFVLGSKIELYDITGRKIYSAVINTESNTTSLNLKEVKQGLYLCVIKNGEEIISSSKISVIKQ